MPSGTSAKRLVADGYDNMGDVYLDRLRGKRRPEITAFVDEAVEGLPEGTSVLDLGCGAGRPYSEYLSARFDVVGVDISQRQLAMARGFLPDAAFLLADMASLPFGNATFGAITALYSIIHLPRAEHAALFSRIRELLEPGGRVFGVMGQSDWVASESDWLDSGVEMYWSHFDADTNLRLVGDAGFRVIRSQIVPDPIGGGHLYVLAERT
ncbi:MAG: methyltransferase domain-containing protein [Chloroflexi bacterium]|nr:methyltransferase domain-containing protein [Chloroflexota bacterium]